METAAGRKWRENGGGGEGCSGAFRAGRGAALAHVRATRWTEVAGGLCAPGAGRLFLEPVKEPPPIPLPAGRSHSRSKNWGKETISPAAAHLPSRPPQGLSHTDTRRVPITTRDWTLGRTASHPTTRGCSTPRVLAS